MLQKKVEKAKQTLQEVYCIIQFLNGQWHTIALEFGICGGDFWS